MKTTILIIIALACVMLGLILQAFGNDYGLISLIIGWACVRVAQKERKVVAQPIENTYIPKI